MFRTKKELILRLVAHEYWTEISESNIEETNFIWWRWSCLREIVQEHSGENIEDQVKDSTKPVESKKSSFSQAKYKAQAVWKSFFH